MIVPAAVRCIHLSEGPADSALAQVNSTAFRALPVSSIACTSESLPGALVERFCPIKHAFLALGKVGGLVVLRRLLSYLLLKRPNFLQDVGPMRAAMGQSRREAGQPLAFIILVR